MVTRCAPSDRWRPDITDIRMPFVKRNIERQLFFTIRYTLKNKFAQRFNNLQFSRGNKFKKLFQRLEADVLHLLFLADFTFHSTYCRIKIEMIIGWELSS